MSKKGFHFGGGRLESFATSEINKIMQSDVMKVRFEVDTMRQQLLHHFADYQKAIEAAIKESVTPENLSQQVQKQVNDTLAWKIGMELDGIVRKAVQDSKELNKLILDSVYNYIGKIAAEKKNSADKFTIFPNEKIGEEDKKAA